MADFGIRIRGLDELRNALGDDGLIDDGLRPGLNKAGVLVEGAWKSKAHRVTGKYQGSLGHEVTGQGIGLEMRAGPQPGLGQPRRYSRSMTGHWKTPRDGVNRGDPTVYAAFEDRRPGHEAAEPALTDNVERIADLIGDSFEAAMRRRF